MQIHLHIGLANVGADRLQSVLASKRDQLISQGVLYPRSPGNESHARLCMAVTDPDHIDTLRYEHGITTAAGQKELRDSLAEDLAKEVTRHKPEHLILSAPQLGTSLASCSELERLHVFLRPFSEKIRIIAHIDEPARLLARYYGEQIMQGRAISLDQELGLAGTSNWWADALSTTPQIDPHAGVFHETQAAPFWLDFAALERHWNAVFGVNALTFRAFDPEAFAAETVTNELRAAFGLSHDVGTAVASKVPQMPSAPWLARGRQLNQLILRLLKSKKRVIPRPLWQTFIKEMKVAGAPIDPASLSAISRTFSAQNTTLAEAHNLPANLFKTASAQNVWKEADPTRGFRATQYLLAFMWRIDKATQAARENEPAVGTRLNGNKTDNQAGSAANVLSQSTRQILAPLTFENIQKVRNSSFAPHNNLSLENEEVLATAYTKVPQRAVPEGSTGNVIVGCMKNEAPYIVEWVAFHRAIGVDNFLIYTNDCEDGTREILDRLQVMGFLQHRTNDKLQGNSPQQHALNQSLEEPVIRKAEWIVHIDVDEFINVRTGNGTLQDFLATVPEATNVAMTWRLFGHNGVTNVKDDFVIDQFDHCAPAFCPKPHTVWGFKTMFKNIGAYKKINCHRPGQLDPNLRNKVLWVNGSGKNITNEVAEKGWRSSKKSIGYDLIQLNHYALRSADSFLIKRQRGRALHVDRSIGINYWIRMDWSNSRDVTIKRNLPRLRAEYGRLMQDNLLREWHERGLAWHKARSAELHANPEFRGLYDQALKLKLTDTERVAYVAALDMES